MKPDRGIYGLDGSLSVKAVGHGAWKVLRGVLLYLLVTLALSVVAYAVIACFFSTDEERRLEAENRMYREAYAEMRPREELVRDAIAGLQMRDAVLYSKVFHAEAPDMEALSVADMMYASDTIADANITAYSATRIARLKASASDIETNFARIFGAVAGCSAGTPPMKLPLREVTPARIGASTGNKINPFYKAYVRHTGIDIIAANGTEVTAPADGTVTLVSRSGKGPGNVVEITHAGGYVTRYEHLADIKVAQGQKVTCGKVIATVGITGNSYAPHLHYEVRRDSVVHNPVNFFFGDLRPEDYDELLYMATHTQQSMD